MKNVPITARNVLIAAAFILTCGGCSTANKAHPASENTAILQKPLISSTIIAERIRKSINKASGDLTEGDLEQVQNLVLANTAVTDDELAELKKLPNLSSLALAMCGNVTDTGIKHVAECKTLVTLSLVMTKSSDAGLEEVAKLSQLTTLGLASTRVTHAGVAKLQKALPKCTIHTGDIEARFKASPIEKNPLLGSWVVAEGQRDGKRHAGGISWHFGDNGRVTMSAPDGRLIDSNRYEVDYEPDREGGLLDMFKGDKADGRIMPCIYRLEKDTLWISAHTKFGQPRPWRIRSEKGDKYMTYTLRRVSNSSKGEGAAEQAPAGDGLEPAPEE